MASSKHLRQIFQYARAGNEEAFNKVAEEIIQEEREKQHHLLANDLEEILYGKVSKVLPFQILKEEIPLDKEKNLPLLTVTTASKTLNDIVLSLPLKKPGSLIETPFSEIPILVGNNSLPCVNLEAKNSFISVIFLQI